MPEPIFLYVENDELSREVMKTLLTRLLGYPQVVILESSHNFEEELAKIEPKPTVIFLDIHMEPIDGFEMLRLIHQEESYQKIPVVALTASVMNEEIRKLRESGFDGVIAKPLNYETFPRTLQRILNGEEVWNTR
jgi:two-component system sensor histidine kinase EvgS